MKLWLISHSQPTSWYDQYKKAVVAAPTREEAALMHPNGYSRYEPSESDDWPSGWASWCARAKFVQVQYLGDAQPGIRAGVICAEYQPN